MLVFLRVFIIGCSALLVAGASASEPRELKVACGSVGIELKLCMEAVERWSKENHYPASVVSMPSAATERLALYQQFLSAKEGTIDVFQIDVIWPGILKTHLLDLTPYVPKEEIEQHFPSIITNNTIEGKLLALPLYTDVGILYYRKDLLDKYKLPVPETWAQLTDTAHIVQKGERAAGTPDFWGFVWQGKQEGLTCNAVEWVFSEGGGTIVDESGKVTIVNENAIRAIDRAASWVGDITPPGVLNYTEEESRGVFQSGKALFMRNWPYAWSLAQNDESVIKGKIGVTLLPSDGKHPRSGTLGGWEMAVSRYSESPEKAVELARYLTGPETQRHYALRASYNPTRMALYKQKDVVAALPRADVLYEALSQAVPRPSRVTGVRYNQLSNGFSNAVQATLAKDGDAETNLKVLEHRLRRISKEGAWK